MLYDWTPLLLTFKLALVTTLILVVIGVPLAWWLAYSRRKFKPFFETLVSMPLVLPPTVLGFYLLVALGPNSFLGRWLENCFDMRIVFSFFGLVIGSVIFSLPFMVNPLKAGFQNLPRQLAELSYVLGKSKIKTLLKVLLPNMKPSILTGLVMTFAHTVGEFGVVLMIGGSIPGKTRVASIAIFGEVEALNYETAAFYSLILVIVAFVMLMSLHLVNREPAKVF